MYFAVSPRLRGLGLFVPLHQSIENIRDELLEKSGYYRRLYDLQFNRPTEETSETTPEPDVLEEELVSPYGRT